jgi:hypothetical protein
MRYLTTGCRGRLTCGSWRASGSQCVLVFLRRAVAWCHARLNPIVRAHVTPLTLDAAQSRTDAKLSYAEVHLRELEGCERRGDTYDRAHQESFLFHLFGVRDAFLQELNVRYALGLPLNGVTLNTITNRVREKGVLVPALDALVKLENDAGSWLSAAKELRDYSTHRHGVPRTYYVGGDHHGETHLRNTKSGALIEQDFVQLYRTWHANMGALVHELRGL